MRGTLKAFGIAAAGLWLLGSVAPAAAEPTKYCAARIDEAEDTVKEVEAALGRLKEGQDKADIQALVTEAKQHLATAKSADQEEACVISVELSKTASQNALFAAAQAE